jgi:DNA polymerase-3 subunit epsilon
MRETFIVLDFETTGLEPSCGARATEVAAVLVEKGQIVDKFQSLMNAGVYVPSFIQELTGITNGMISKAPPISGVMRDFSAFIGSTPLVAHNASFDKKFLDAELDRIGHQARQPIICSMRIARRVYQSAPNHKLETLVKHAGIETSGGFHRALADAEMTARLMLKMASDLRRSYNLNDVSFELMRKLQAMPKYEVNDRLKRS